MKLPAALCLLAVAGCATAPAMRTNGDTRAARQAPELSEPVRLETRAGTFLVQPENAEDFGRALAGEPTDKHYSADISF
jgi:hypothetical protein